MPHPQTTQIALIGRMLYQQYPNLELTDASAKAHTEQQKLRGAYLFAVTHQLTVSVGQLGLVLRCPSLGLRIPCLESHVVGKLYVCSCLGSR